MTTLPSPDDTLSQVKFIDPAVVFAAATSSISSRLVCHPLDTMRLRIQTYPSAKLPPLAELIPKPAIRSLYAGLPVAMTIGIPALSVYLATYEGIWPSFISYCNV